MDTSEFRVSAEDIAAAREEIIAEVRHHIEWMRKHAPAEAIASSATQICRATAWASVERLAA